MKAFSIFLFSLLITSGILAQKPVDLKLQPSNSIDQASCFDILLRSPAGHDIDLAGQNYRLFYNADRMSFLDDRISHNLDPMTYSKVDILKTEDHNVGFVSISIDGRALTNKVVQLNKDASWQHSINICFDRKTVQPYELTWANSKKTALFATAEVAMSEWVDEENQQILTPNEVFDYSSIESDTELSKSTIDLKIYPNPVADYINIDFGQDLAKSDLIIKDVIGREVVNAKIDGGSRMNYKLDDWPEGTYTVLILDENGNRLSSQNIIKINP